MNCAKVLSYSLFLQIWPGMWNMQQTRRKQFVWACKWVFAPPSSTLLRPPPPWAGSFLWVLSAALSWGCRCFSQVLSGLCSCFFLTLVLQVSRWLRLLRTGCWAVQELELTFKMLFDAVRLEFFTDSTKEQMCFCGCEQQTGSSQISESEAQQKHSCGNAVKSSCSGMSGCWEAKIKTWRAAQDFCTVVCVVVGMRWKNLMFVFDFVFIYVILVLIVS